MKKLVLVSTVTLIAIAMVACKPGKKTALEKQIETTGMRNRRVEQAVQGALAGRDGIELEAWHALEHRWPCSQRMGFVWHDDKKKFQGDAVVVNGVEDRYVLRLIMSFEVSADFNDVKFTQSRVHFSELGQVTPSIGGGFSITFNTEADRWFGIQELNQLRQANWDFSALGISIKSNAPVQNFRKVLPRL